ncbi:MAG: hypothetical protein ACK5KR_06620 [Breznakia sp.]
MQKWIIEADTKSINKKEDISTKFTLQQEFLFLSYEVQNELFTWSVNGNDSVSVVDPIVYIATPENMSYYENESLMANG